MQIKYHTAVFIAVAFGFLSGASGVVFTQESIANDGPLLEYKLTDIEIHGDSIFELLGELASKLQIPIGYENLEGSGNGCQLNGSLTVRTKDMAVRELVQMIDANSSNCEWQVSGGVVDFFSKSPSRTFNNLSITNFAIKKGTSRRDIKRAIQGVPELKTVLEPSEYITFFVNPVEDELPISKSFELRSSHYKLRDILNGLAKETSSKYWTLMKWRSSDSAVFLAF